ncbi:MAG TPA: DNA-3-methyladenine glycosylase I [Edaphocola sp.]|nr:DNA-3-methyladenine glycosylase I [Edaphocola sp.]
MSYCNVIKEMQVGERRSLHENYHNYHYGFPLHDDNELFGRLILEVFQAGLSWETILKKEENFKKAFQNYDIKKIACFGKKDFDALIQNAGIIRNKLKINATIYNAQKIVELQNEYGSFEKWLASNHSLVLQDWVKLFKKSFKFTGPEIVNEFLMSIGYLPGAHEEGCPVYKEILFAKPMWNDAKQI